MRETGYKGQISEVLTNHDDNSISRQTTDQYWVIVGSMLGQRRRRWPNIEPTMAGVCWDVTWLRDIASNSSINIPFISQYKSYMFCMVNMTTCSMDTESGMHLHHLRQSTLKKGKVYAIRCKVYDISDNNHDISSQLNFRIYIVQL